jgi:hypothetical protein
MWRPYASWLLGWGLANMYIMPGSLRMRVFCVPKLNNCAGFACLFSPEPHQASSWVVLGMP